MEKKDKNTKGKKRVNILNILITLTAICGLVWIVSTFVHIGSEYTDNAQIRRHITPINSRIQGFVKEIRFNEFQEVKKGDTLVIIEDTEYRLKVLQAESALISAQQSRTAASTQASTAQNNIGINEAAIEEVEVLLENAQREKERYARLLAEGAVTQQQYDAVETNCNATRARYNMMLRQRTSTTLVSDEQELRLEQQNTFVETAETALELARLNLSYTIITAPCNGVMGRRNIQEGQLIQSGQAVANIVDDSEVWVLANYKERQIANIKEGAQVNITVDAVPDVLFKGFVHSISDATGAQFSLLPTDNSAGNFVKVEQRIPVRIEFSAESDTALLNTLRSGMNVECNIEF